MDPKIINFLTNFGAILGPFWGQKRLQKVTKNGTNFGTLSLRLAEVRGKRFCELNESGEIAIATGIIIPKRKGGIYIYIYIYIYTCIHTYISTNHIIAYKDKS